MKWFTADPHFGHENIIRFCGRDQFKNAAVMDNRIIENYNNVVSADDDFYFVGDFTMAGSDRIGYISKLLSKINGRKHLILGNHDSLNPFTYVNHGFQSVHTSLVVTLKDKEEVILNHDPAPACGVHDPRRWVVGHLHNLFQTMDDGRIINVGVDVWGFRPVSEDTLIGLRGMIGGPRPKDVYNTDYHREGR